jgi:hypothetical protein
MHAIRTVAIALSGLVVLGSSAQAQVRGLLRLGGEYGGDEVIQFTYADGSTPEVTAGGGLLLSAGAALRLIPLGSHALEAQVNAGVKYRTIPPATNQSANWLRFPVEALAFYRAPMGLRLGGGATVHLQNVLEASGDALNDRVEFQTKPGYVFQAEYLLRKVSFDARYTILKYEIENEGTVNANSLGLGISFWFGGSQKSPTPR